MKRNYTFLLFVSILFVCLIFLSALEVKAADIHVTTTQDKISGSLRAALTTANTNNEADTIYLPAGTYLLTGSSGDDGNIEGDLDFDSSQKITIIGAGSESTIINGNQVDRVLHILAGTVSIAGVTIKKGKTPDADYFQDSEGGGGIKNSGSLELNQCTIIENSTGKGSLAVYGSDDDIAGNSGEGGGIYNSGSLTLSLCQVTGNSTGKGGGGGLGDTGGKSGSGGGIFSSGSLTLTDCIIDSNSTGLGGRACGGGDSGNGGGICITSTGEANLKRCTVNNNSTSPGGYAGCAGGPFHGGHGGNGGGIYNEGDIVLINCTVYYNDAGEGGSTDSAPLGVGGSGGGIYSKGEIYLRCCTIANNFINYCYPDMESGKGGGVYGANYILIYMENTIVADNYILSSGGEGPDCWGNVRSHGYNLIENTNWCFIEGGPTEDITGVDPKLGFLADNGGPTPTCALPIDSPAIDAGYSRGLSEDQRGFLRPVDMPDIYNKLDGADIGAYEYIPYTISGYVTYHETGLENVSLTFSNNGGTTTTDKNGFYSHSIRPGWSGTATPAKEGYMFEPTFRTYTSIQSDYSGQDYESELADAPIITVNRNRLNFAIDSAGNSSTPQTFLIANGGGGPLNWSITDNASWLNCTPSTGVNSTSVTASLNNVSLSPGTYNGTINISSAYASNSPVTIAVSLTVFNSSASGVPFGYFETPTDGADVFSSIPVTGWVLDDIGVDSVKIYRSENKDFIYIGDAIFVEGARPDVEIAYPGYPSSYKAGWGYMLLTNFLPNGGNGTFILHAIATDIEGNRVELGQKTIHVDNANAVLPFGAIDSPAQGGIASGTSYRNQGWALTPLPNKIPEDGHTLKVWIDGVNVGNPIYNIYRSDIATLFPGYANSNGAMAYFDFDTTGYDNGVHTIEWNATDNAGNSDGIGSRYFSIQNAGQQKSQESSGFKNGYMTRKLPWKIKKMLDFSLTQIPCAYSEPIGFQEGYYTGLPLEIRYPGEDGNFSVEIKELTRIEIHLDWNNESEDGDSKADDCTNAKWWGVMAVGDDFRKLPIGSSLDSQRGIFRWMPGVGFLGSFRMVFVKELTQGNLIKKIITFHLIPKF